MKLAMTRSTKMHVYINRHFRQYGYLVYSFACWTKELGEVKIFERVPAGT
jgi:hypothetical protein